jgi:hypothetical protein
MWVKKLWQRYLGGSARLRLPPPRRRNTRLALEQLEDRTVPSSFTAASVSDLIADINAANLAGGSNTITLAAKKTFSLTAVDNSTLGPSGLAVIAANDNLTIVGNGDTIERSTAKGTPAFRLFAVASGAALTLQNLTVQGGLENTGWGGGGIFTQGSLNLTGVNVLNNAAYGPSSGGAGIGGGIYVSGGTASLSNCTVSNNIAQGVGFAMSSGVFGNASGYDGQGGGLYVSGGTVSLSNCTVSNNTALGQSEQIGAHKHSGCGSCTPGYGLGGALYIEGGTVDVVGCTVEQNTSSSGGVIYILGGASAGPSVCLDAFTVAHVIHNTPNFIDGSYTIC